MKTIAIARKNDIIEVVMNIGVILVMVSGFLIY